ncbi:MAG: cell envelope integrity protein TolA, partial [Methylococcales bacterium]
KEAAEAKAKAAEAAKEAKAKEATEAKAKAAEAAKEAKAKEAAEAKAKAAEAAKEAKAKEATEAKAKAAEAAKQKAEAEANAKQAAEAVALAKQQADAAAQQKAQVLAAKAAANAQALEDAAKKAIQAKVERNWTRPLSSSSGSKCQLQLKMLPNGEVLSVDVVSGGDEAFNSSCENAVVKSSPLPVPTDKELFNRVFRKFKLTFTP